MGRVIPAALVLDLVVLGTAPVEGVFLPGLFLGGIGGALGLGGGSLGSGGLTSSLGAGGGGGPGRGGTSGS